MHFKLIFFILLFVLKLEAFDDDSIKQLSLREALSQSLQPNSPLITEAECPYKTRLSLGFEAHNATCGSVRVPEFHNAKGVQKNLGLGYIYVSKGGGKKPLLVIEQGGPGGSSMSLVAMYVSFERNLLNHFDILGVEQRGTEWTWPNISCDALTQVRLQTLNVEDSEDEEFKSLNGCLKEASKKMDVSSISTYQIASDIRFIASKFGHEKFSYLGVSYGTLVGQYLMQYYPQSLNKVVLDSPVVPGVSWKSSVVLKAEVLFKENMEDFSQSYFKGEKRYKQALEVLKRAYVSIKNNPMELSYTYKNKAFPVLFDEEGVLSLVMFFSGKNYSNSRMVNFVDHLRGGVKSLAERQEFFSKILNRMIDVEDTRFEIMYQQILCREFEIDQGNDFFASMKKWTEISKIFPEKDFDQILNKIKNQKACSLKLSQKEEQKKRVLSSPITSEIRTLVLGGKRDHVTMPENVTLISKNFSNVDTYIFQNLGHVVFSKKKCVAKSVLEFLKTSVFKNSCQ